MNKGLVGFLVGLLALLGGAFVATMLLKDKIVKKREEEDDEDEYEVTASFDDMQQKPPAAYSVKYDRAKGSWVIARAGQQRPVRRVATKEEALKIARELAKKTGAGLYVHKKDGKFQKVYIYK